MLAVEVVESGAGEVPGLQRGDERVEIVQARRGPSSCRRRRRRMAAKLVGVDHPERLGGGGGVHRHHVGLGQHRVERVVGGLGRSTGRRRSPSCPVPRSASGRRDPRRRGRRARRCARPAARRGSAGRGSSRRRRSRRCARHDRRAAGGGSPRTAARPPARPHRRRCGPGVRSTGMPLAVAAGTSTLVGSPRVEPMTRSGRSSTSPEHEVGLADEDGRADLVDALGQLACRPRCAAGAGRSTGRRPRRTAARAGSRPSPRHDAVTNATGLPPLPLFRT